MPRKHIFLLFGLFILLLAACKRGRALPLETLMADISPESTPFSTSSSPTTALQALATETAISPSNPTSIPARSSPTAAPVGLKTQTITPTPAPRTLEVTSTAAPAAADPTHLPTPTMLPEYADFTPDELVNQGKHRYAVACQSWGNCACDDTRTGASVELVIEFSERVVNITDPGGSFLYPKQASRHYVLEDEKGMLEVIFQFEGFQVTRTQAGAACWQYIYIRDVSPK